MALRSLVVKGRRQGVGRDLKSMNAIRKKLFSGRG
jgi:hypothetical protein